MELNNRDRQIILNWNWNWRFSGERWGVMYELMQIAHQLLLARCKLKDQLAPALLPSMASKKLMQNTNGTSTTARSS
jgi:hypothetical protein